MIDIEIKPENTHNEKCPNCDNTTHKIIRYWTGRPNFVECLSCSINWVPKTFKR